MAPHVRIPRYATQAVNRRLGAAVRHLARRVGRRRAARHPLGRRLVSRAMAGVALAGGFEAHGGRAYALANSPGAAWSRTRASSISTGWIARWRWLRSTASGSCLARPLRPRPPG